MNSKLLLRANDTVVSNLGTSMNRRTIMKNLAGASVAVLAVAAVGSTASAHHTEQTYTVSANANFRSGPGTNYSILGVVYKGQTFKINGSVQNGYAGIIFNGKTGWVLASLIVGADSNPAPDWVDSAWVMANVNLRKGPGTSYTVLKVIPFGSQIAISNTIQNGFRYVSHAGTAGWVSTLYITPYDPNADYAYTLANVNLRSQPSTSSSILLVIPKSTPVQYLNQQSGDFLKVSFNGKTGWVHKDYLKVY